MAAEFKEFTIKFKTDNAGVLQNISLVENKFKGLEKQVKHSNSAFKEMKSLLGGLAIGGLIFKAAKDVIEMDKAVMNLGRKTGASTKDLLAFKTEAMKLGVQTGTNSEELIKMSQAAYESGKDFKFAKDNLTLMNTVAMATGAPMEQIGEAFGEIYHKTGLAGPAIKALMDSLFAFGRTKGREADLTKILPDIPRLIKLYQATGEKIPLDQFIMKFMFAEDSGKLEEIISKLISTPTTKFTKMHATKTTDIFKLLKQFEQNAIREGVSADKRLESIATAMRGLGIKFRAEDIKKLIEAQDEYTESVGESKKNLGALNTEANRQSNTLNATMGKLNESLKSIGDKALSPALSKLAEDFNSMDPKAIEGLTAAFSGLGSVIVTVVGSLGSFMNLWGKFWEDYANKLYGIEEFKFDPKKEQARVETQSRLNKEFSAAPGSKSGQGYVFGGGTQKQFDVTSMAGNIVPQVQVQVHNYLAGVEVPSQSTKTQTNHTVKQQPRK